MSEPLVITIKNSEPIEASALARTLSALSADYRRISGHELVVHRAESSSLILWLVDEALKRIGEFDDLAEFARILRGLWQAAVTGNFRPKRSRRAGSSSIAELVELSARSHAKITVSKREADGTEVTLEIMPEVARDVRRSFEDKPPKPSLDRAMPKLHKAEIELESYAKSVLESGRAVGTAIQGPDGRLDIIQVLLDIIRGLPEGREILDRVRNRLRANGYDPDTVLGP